VVQPIQGYHTTKGKCGAMVERQLAGENQRNPQEIPARVLPRPPQI
jgi:hypothetical protein